ncbi:hypothetical protein NOK12_09210 [Nocardioides sp. OK12]|nr:hypothetical protein NOK12_09210 [Nocardioides sp. OK12]
MSPTRHHRASKIEAVSSPRPSPGPRRRLLLGAVKLGAVLAVVAVLTGTLTGAPSPSVAPSDPTSDRLDRLMTLYGCSTAGLEDGAVPASAVLRSEEGALRMVDFERGWAAYEGTASGTLVAVCARPLT